MLVLGGGSFFPMDFVWCAGAWGAVFGAWCGQGLADIACRVIQRFLKPSFLE